MSDRETWDDPRRWAHSTPPPPKIDFTRRRELAREWLTFLGCPVSEERVEELGKVVMRYHPLSPKGQTANRIAAEGRTPYRAVVEREHAQWHRARMAALAKRKQLSLTDSQWLASQLEDESTVSGVLDYIRTFRAQRHEGPRWADVSLHMGWPKKLGPHVLKGLAKKGRLTYTPQARSLNVSMRS